MTMSANVSPPRFAMHLAVLSAYVRVSQVVEYKEAVHAERATLT